MRWLVRSACNAMLGATAQREAPCLPSAWQRSDEVQIRLRFTATTGFRLHGNGAFLNGQLYLDVEVTIGEKTQIGPGVQLCYGRITARSRRSQGGVGVRSPAEKRLPDW